MQPLRVPSTVISACLTLPSPLLLPSVDLVPALPYLASPRNNLSRISTDYSATQWRNNVPETMRTRWSVSARAHLPQFSERPNTWSNRSLEIAFLCAPRLYCALSLRDGIYKREWERGRERKRSKRDEGVRSLKLERPVYCTIRDARKIVMDFRSSRKVNCEME